jgi:predicted porin
MFGLEAGRSFGLAGVEVFLGAGEEDVDTVGTFEFAGFGLEGAYDITPAVSLTGSLSGVAFEDVTLTRIAIGGEYRFNDRGPAIYAEVGRLTATADEEGEDEGESSGTNYVGLGARIAIGPNGGTTFDSRGLSELLTGF